MDLIAAGLLIAGWITGVKGLIIASLSVSGFMELVLLLSYHSSEKKGEDALSIMFSLSILVLSIIKLCI